MNVILRNSTISTRSINEDYSRQVGSSFFVQHPVNVILVPVIMLCNLQTYLQTMSLYMPRAAKYWSQSIQITEISNYYDELVINLIILFIFSFFGRKNN